ncbi:hypothetical protein F4604DRAFT_1684763 [Suillus subluteus]|nr:hypothetical protein F4604DRAFT_1684763 [Suillus subluteus]
MPGLGIHLHSYLTTGMLKWPCSPQSQTLQKVKDPKLRGLCFPPGDIIVSGLNVEQLTLSQTGSVPSDFSGVTVVGAVVWVEACHSASRFGRTGSAWQMRQNVKLQGITVAKQWESNLKRPNCLSTTSKRKNLKNLILRNGSLLRDRDDVVHINTKGLKVKSKFPFWSSDRGLNFVLYQKIDIHGHHPSWQVVTGQLWIRHWCTPCGAQGTMGLRELNILEHANNWQIRTFSLNDLPEPQSELWMILNWKTFRGKAEVIAGREGEFLFMDRLSRKRRLRCNDSALLRWTSEDLSTTKMLSAGFEPTPMETDFDSVVVTTHLRPVRRTSEETFKESMSRKKRLVKKSSVVIVGFEPPLAVQYFGQGEVDTDLRGSHP